MKSHEKPVMFFSHSKYDKRCLVKLKEMFDPKAAGAIELFLSSDGQSIKFGSNWVHRVQEALDSAHLMVVFVSPNALRSDWVLFESGFAYAKGIRVVPVGFFGVDIASLPPPLGLLQGFNISGADGLNNLIAIANDEFHLRIASQFTQQEYESVLSESSIRSDPTFGDYGAFIHSIEVSYGNDNELRFTKGDALAQAKQLLEAHGMSVVTEEDAVRTHGARFGVRVAFLDPLLAQRMFPLLEKFLGSIRTKGLRGAGVSVTFAPSIWGQTASTNVTARLLDSPVQYVQSGLIFKDLQFGLKSVARQIRLDARIVGDTLSTVQFRDLITLLFERNVLYLAEDEETITFS